MTWALVIGVATAQTWSREASGVIVPEAGTITANGVGSPTVVWDPAISRYVLFFETMSAPADADCPAGYWSIGAAVSDDGVSFEVWPDPVVAPTPGTPFRCVAAHPSVTLDGSTYHLYFKAEQGPNACAAGNQPWGCGNYTGVVHATVAVALDDLSDEIAVVEADITTLEGERDAAMDAFETALVDYRDQLVANESEFACTEDAPICMPCGQVELSAQLNLPDTHTFCQDFEFAVPTTVDVSPANVPTSAVFSLTVTPSVGAQFTCLYRYRGGSWVLDFGSSQAVDNRCSLVTATGGSSATAGTVQLGVVSSPPAVPPTVSVVLDATNLGSQTASNGVVGSIDALIPAVQADDYAATIDGIPQLVNDLTVLATWLSTFPGDPQKADLRVDAFVLGSDALDLYDGLVDWQAELDVLYADLADLQAYTQSVVATWSADLALALSRTLGYPSVMKTGNGWVMLLQDYPAIKRATAASPEGPFTLDPTPAIDRGQVSWAMTEVFDPNLVCDDGAMPYQAYFGGRTLTGGVITDGGISDAVSSDTITWLANVATRLVGWTDPNSFRHFDLIRSTTGHYRGWYSEKVNGLNQIGVGGTTRRWTHSTSTQRVCP